MRRCARCRRKHPRCHREDAANATAQEALFVTLLITFGAAIYASFPLPGSPSINPARGPVEQYAADLLDSLKELPGSDRFSTQLEKTVARGVQGNSTAFDNLVERTMPPGAECRMWINNGYQARQVAGPSERLARESVGTELLWRPKWAYAFALPGLDLISELQPLAIQAYEVSQGRLVKEYGVPVTFTLTTDQGVYDKATLTAARPDAPTASLFLLNETNAASYAYLDDPAAQQTTALKHLTAPGPLPQPESFTAPAGQDQLVITSRFTGTSVRYTMTFQAPGGASWDLDAERPGWANLSIPFPEAGAWTFTASGTVAGDFLNPASAELWVNSTVTGAASDWTVVVREEAGKAIPAGTLLNVSLPGVLTGLDRTSRAQAGWVNVQSSDSVASEPWVSAELAAPLQGAQLQFKVKAGLPLDGDALYGLMATLSNGTTARAAFVLGSTQGGMGLENTLDHDLVVSAPKPHASAARALWGAVLAYPATVGAGEVVTRLDVRTHDGSALFGSVEGLSPPGAWSVVAPGHLRWEGLQVVQPNRFLGFAFNVTTLASLVQQDEPGVSVPVVFGEGAGGPAGSGAGAEFRMTMMERPWVYGLNVPPPTDILGDPQAGFTIPAGSGPLTRGNGTFSIAQVQRGLLVKGEGVYGVTAWGSLSVVAQALRMGLARSHLDVSRPWVKLGEEINVSVDFEGLFDEVELAGMPLTAWNVEVKVFDPAQPFVSYAEMVPSLHGKFGASVNPSYEGFRPKLDAIAPWATSSVDVFTRASANITMQVPRNSFYGPHAVVVQANFLVEDPVSGVSMVQSARVLGVIDVVPDGGQNASALYWAGLECWLPDW